VLAVAIVVVALKLFLWSREEDVVGVDVEPHREDVLPFDHGELRFRDEAQETEPKA
jgi:hypothetical protein